MRKIDYMMRHGRHPRQMYAKNRVYDAARTAPEANVCEKSSTWSVTDGHQAKYMRKIEYMMRPGGTRAKYMLKIEYMMRRRR